MKEFAISLKYAKLNTETRCKVALATQYICAEYLA